MNIPAITPIMEYFVDTFRKIAHVVNVDGELHRCIRRQRRINRISRKSYRKSVDAIECLMEFIRENLDQKLTLSLLAEKANMSVATLTRHFREVLQTSPMQYVTACRISLARELLATGKLNKTEIAQSCGFFDVSHMNKYL